MRVNALTNYGQDMTGVAAIGEALKVNKTLLSIEYAANIQTSLVEDCESFTPSAPTDIVCLLFGSLSLNRLCGLDSFGDGTYTAEGIVQIAEVLKVNTTLQSVKCAACCPNPTYPSTHCEPFTPLRPTDTTAH